MIKQIEKFLILNTNIISQYIKNSIFSSLMMTNLINDLLVKAKMDQAKLDIDFEYFNMIEVVS